MADPSLPRPCPDPSRFPDCPGHDPRKCKSHKEGRQCRRSPVNGSEVCPTHGGRAPQVRQAAEVRHAEEKLRRKLGLLVAVPVENHLAELKALAGKAKAWMGVCEEHMAELERLRYSSAEGGEHIRGEVVLFERALESCRKVLVDLARLDIDERLVKLTEGNLLLALQLADGVLRRSGVDPESSAVREAKAAEMLAIAAAPEPGRVAA